MFTNSLAGGGGKGISPMVTSMKSKHESVPLTDSVVRLYIAAYGKYCIGGVNMGESRYISHDNIHEINTWKCLIQNLEK